MRVYICFPNWKNDSLLDPLREKAEIVIADKRPTREELKLIAQKYDGIIVGRLSPVDRDVLTGSKLKFVGLVAKGTANVDIEACKDNNVAMFYTPEANINSVAEYVMASILAQSKNLFHLDKEMRKGEFYKYRTSTIDVKDKVLGIIGAGAVAKELIKRAKGFGMKMLCYTFNPDKHPNLDVEFVSLQDLLKNSDFVSVNIALSEKTENLIDKEEISMMKKSAYLINSARGKIVNENALIDALKNKKIAGAGIDVFENEPDVNKGFFELENVILTPHVAGVSREALNRMEEHVVNDIVAFLDGKQPKYRLA